MNQVMLELAEDVRDEMVLVRAAVDVCRLRGERPTASAQELACELRADVADEMNLAKHALRISRLRGGLQPDPLNPLLSY